MSDRVTPKQAAGLLDRLCGLPGWPAQPIAQRALADMLAARAATLDHAVRIVAHLEETSMFAPVPAAIAQAANDIPAKLPVPLGCSLCCGSGWKIERRGLYDGAERCSCERGRYLQALSQQYAAEAR